MLLSFTKQMMRHASNMMFYLFEKEVHMFWCLDPFTEEYLVKLLKFVLQILKLYAWEESFQNIITTVRRKELRVLRYIAVLQSAQIFNINLAPCIVI